MILTLGYFLLVGLASVVLNPFLVFGLALVDIVIIAVIGQVALVLTGNEDAIGDDGGDE